MIDPMTQTPPTLNAAEEFESEQKENSEQLAVRLAALDLTRCTEQASILASLLMGRGIGGHDTEDRGMYRPTVGRLVLRTMLGYLADANFNIRFAELQETAAFYHKPDYAEQIWKPFRALLERREKPDLDLELLCIPVDGLGDLLRGYTGAASMIVGGPPGSFRDVLKKDADGEIVRDIRGRPQRIVADEYLTVCVSSTIAASLNAAGESFDPNEWLQSTADNSHSDVVSVLRKLIQDACRHSGKRLEQFTVGTLENKDISPFRRSLGVKWRLRTFAGSPVGGAISACLGTVGIDAFAAIVKPIEAAFISSAAMATGGRVFHIPVKWIECKEVTKNKWVPLQAEEVVEKGVKTKKVAYVNDAKFGDASSFVASNKDVFLIATGVGESALLDGVRYLDVGTASTHTLCICSRTQSTRYLVLNHNLRRRKYPVLTEDCTECEWQDYEQMSQLVTELGSQNSASN